MLLGWHKMNKLRFYSMLLSTACLFTTQAADKQPDMAFLEYLGSLVEINGELVGPLDFKEKASKIAIDKIDRGTKTNEQNLKDSANNNTKKSAKKSATSKTKESAQNNIKQTPITEEDNND